MNRHRVLLLALATILGGCGIIAVPSLVQQPTSARPQPVRAVAASNGAIYQAASNYQPLFEDRRARNIGDTLVVNINEKVAASKQSGSSAARNGNVSASVPLLKGVPLRVFQGLGVTADSKNGFDGKGQSASKNDFSGTITVTVTDVLANGNLIIAGEKQIGINQGSEYIRLSGVVNPNTIVGNSVSSVQVADARIEYRGKGYIDEAQTMGWAQRIFLNVLPF